MMPLTEYEAFDAGGEPVARVEMPPRCQAVLDHVERLLIGEESRIVRQGEMPAPPWQWVALTGIAGFLFGMLLGWCTA